MSSSSREPLKGQIWVFSGQINGLSHQKASAELQELGAIVEREVNELTDYVVVGNMPGNSPGKKVETAKILGVTLVPGADFKLRLIEACVEADRKRSARLVGDIAKHEICMDNLDHQLDLAQGAITQAWYEKKHGKVGDETVVVGPNKSAEPFKTETVGAKTQNSKPTLLVVAPLWVCLLAAAFCLVAILWVIL